MTLPTKTLWILGIAMMIIQYMFMEYLEKIYDATGFPVSYMVGQTAFNGKLIKSYYAALLENGTLDDYYFVQIVDYLFMVTVFFSHLFICAAIYRSLHLIKWLKKTGLVMLVVTPLAAVFDGLENLVSFIMLAEPLSFPNWLAYPYSSFAVIKFSLFSVYMLWVTLSIVLIVMHRIYYRLF